MSSDRQSVVSPDTSNAETGSDDDGYRISIETCMRLKQQVEYYLSEENLFRDSYLQQLLQIHEGYLPLSVICGFPKLRWIYASVNLPFSKQLALSYRPADVNVVAKVLQSSNSIDVFSYFDHSIWISPRCRAYNVSHQHSRSFLETSFAALALKQPYRTDSPTEVASALSGVASEPDTSRLTPRPSSAQTIASPQCVPSPFVASECDANRSANMLGQLHRVPDTINVTTPATATNIGTMWRQQHPISLEQVPASYEGAVTHTLKVVDALYHPHNLISVPVMSQRYTTQGAQDLFYYQVYAPVGVQRMTQSFIPIPSGRVPVTGPHNLPNTDIQQSMQQCSTTSEISHRPNTLPRPQNSLESKSKGIGKGKNGQGQNVRSKPKGKDNRRGSSGKKGKNKKQM